MAQQLAQRLPYAVVDTILCMDGTRVIGTCLARRLTQEGYGSVNQGKEIYLLRENVSSGGQLIFRDNARFMLEDKNVLVLLASITTGSTVEKACGACATTAAAWPAWPPSTATWRRSAA